MRGLTINWRRLRQTDVLLALVAATAGIAGTWLASRYVDERISLAEEGLARRYEPARVVVASDDLQRGQSLRQADLAVREMPREFLPADVVPVEAAGALLGSRLAVDVSRGTPISRAWAGQAPAGLSAVLLDSERALTLSVDDLTSHAGGIRAGDRVDLHYARREQGESLLVPLLQRVEVLAVGDSLSAASGRGPAQYSTITLRVLAADAPRVLLAQEAGEIRVLLRSPSDGAAQALRVHRSAELLLERPARSAPGVELLTGGHGGQVPERSWLRVGSMVGEAT